MKKFLSSTKTAIVVLLVTIISLGCYAYMLIRPISYGMGYHTVTEYEGESFESTIKHYPDGTVVTRSTTFKEGIISRYYYKNGYVFSTIAETDEDYRKEVDYINNNFEEAVNSPFYATKTNAFRQVAEGVDGYTLIYTCKAAIVFAISCGIVEAALIGLTCTCFILRRKNGN